VLADDLELAALLLDLPEQARIANRQHRLGGEGLEQVDDLRPELTGHPPSDIERSEDAFVTEQGHRHHRAEAALLEYHPECAGAFRATCERVRRQVGDLHRLAPHGGLAGGADTQTNRRRAHVLAHGLDQVIGHAVRRSEFEGFGRFVKLVDRAGVGAREPRGMRDDGGQHFLEVERGGNRLAHLTKRL
jgi:hypothetical protein